MKSLEECLRSVDPVDPSAPAPDAEPLLREILASGAPATAPARLPRRARAGLAVAVAAAVASGFVLAMPSGENPGVVAAAYEAISQPDSILHYRVRDSMTDAVNGSQTMGTVEVWQAGDGSRIRTIRRSAPNPGDPSATAMWSETVHSADEWRTYGSPNNTIVVYDTEVEPLPGPGGGAGVAQRDLGDPRTLLERARSGDAAVTELGEATVRGIPVVQFRLGKCKVTFQNGGTAMMYELAVVVSVRRDDHTPVRVEHDNSCDGVPQPEYGSPWEQLPRAVADYVEFETLPATAENRKLLKMAPHPGAKVLDGEDIDAAEERDEANGPRPAPTPTP